MPHTSAGARAAMQQQPPQPPARDDEWTVVGASGRAAARNRPPHRSSSNGSSQRAPIATAPETAPPAGDLPGWGGAGTPASSVSSSGAFTYSRSTAGSRRARACRRPGTATPEQQAQQLAQQVTALCGELRAAPMFAALTAAMQQLAAPHLMPQERQQQPHIQQLQQQQQPEQWDWSAVQQLVVYGLGSPEGSKVSRHQLALVLLLRELLPGLREPPQLYDPAFSAADALLLRELGLRLIPANEEGRRSAGGQRTLFYLPHCEGVLCDNLLGANWSPAALGQLAILGNAFSSYASRWAAPLAPAAARPARLLELVHAGVVREVGVPDHRYHVVSAFNDMALHTFVADAARADGLFGGGGGGGRGRAQPGAGGSCGAAT